MKTDKFWMVFRDGGQCPTKRHATEEGACQEAERLALKHLATFYVLESTWDFRLESRPVVSTRIESEN